jgi:DNA-binding transcriptional LysR family regulator
MVWMLYIDRMNVKDVDLNLLRVFAAIAAQQSVTRAGEVLGLTQPAMSNALGRLRLAFDDALFVRTPAGMRPTPRAVEISPAVCEALALLESTLGAPPRFEPASADRLFRFSTSDLGETMFLPPLIEALRREAPRLRIETRPVPLDRIAEALEGGEIDLAMGSLEGLKRGVHAAPLFREPYLCVLRAGHPRAARPVVKRDLADLEYVIVAPEETAHRKVDLALKRLGLAQHVAVRMPHFMAIPGILERSDLVAVVPEMLAELFCRDGRLAMQPFPAPLAQLQIRVFWHQRFEQDAANRWMRELVIRLHRKPD